MVESSLASRMLPRRVLAPRSGGRWSGPYSCFPPARDLRYRNEDRNEDDNGTVNKKKHVKPECRYLAVDILYGKLYWEQNQPSSSTALSTRSPDHQITNRPVAGGVLPNVNAQPHRCPIVLPSPYPSSRDIFVKSIWYESGQASAHNSFVVDHEQTRR